MIHGPPDAEGQLAVELWVVGRGGGCLCSNRCAQGGFFYPEACGNDVCEDGGPGSRLGAYLFGLGDDCDDCGPSTRFGLAPGELCSCTAYCLNDGVCNMPISDDCTCHEGFTGRWCWTTVCGDGRRIGLEECDDGNEIDSDGCNSVCMVERGWVCAGDGHDPDVCDGRCGDGYVRGLEACDDSNTLSGDGCSANCTVEAGYSCGEDGLSCAVLACDPVCENGGVCSQPSGNTCTCPSIYSGTRCASGVCGDGHRVASEACDDGNTRSGDGCDPQCLVETGYTCFGSVPDRCTDACSAQPCVNGGECVSGQCQCAAGYSGPDCSTETCGDGVRSVSEECDDQNLLDFDGCDVLCLVERGFECFGLAPDLCNPVCGDGFNFHEACDDGNEVDGDGCSSQCEVERGPWTCAGGSFCAKDVCEIQPICGDSFVATGEACDDGNVEEGDGCSANCEVEAGWECLDNRCTVAACSRECRNGGVCLLPTQDSCACAFGFHGLDCGSVLPCSSGCHATQGTCWMPYLDECVCHTGYAGADCSQIATCTLPCHNEGSCLQPAHNYCYCPEGFFGVDCTRLEEASDPADACARLPNVCNGGKCVDEAGSDGVFSCICPPGYSGEHCTESPCALHPCSDDTTLCLDVTREVFLAHWDPWGCNDLTAFPSYVCALRAVGQVVSVARSGAVLITAQTAPGPRSWLTRVATLPTQGRLFLSDPARPGWLGAPIEVEGTEVPFGQVTYVAPPRWTLVTDRDEFYFALEDTSTSYEASAFPTFADPTLADHVAQLGTAQVLVVLQDPLPFGQEQTLSTSQLTPLRIDLRASDDTETPDGLVFYLTRLPGRGEIHTDENSWRGSVITADMLPYRLSNAQPVRGQAGRMAGEAQAWVWFVPSPLDVGTYWSCVMADPNHPWPELSSSSSTTTTTSVTRALRFAVADELFAQSDAPVWSLPDTEITINVQLESLTSSTSTPSSSDPGSYPTPHASAMALHTFEDTRLRVVFVAEARNAQIELTSLPPRGRLFRPLTVSSLRLGAVYNSSDGFPLAVEGGEAIYVPPEEASG
jgi:cysteine-rich repeat protein